MKKILKLLPITLLLLTGCNKHSHIEKKIIEQLEDNTISYKLEKAENKEDDNNIYYFLTIYYRFSEYDKRVLTYIVIVDEDEEIRFVRYI